MVTTGRKAQEIFKKFGLNEEKKLDMVKDTFGAYFAPKINYTFEQYKFNQIKLKQEEIIKEFLTRVIL